QAIARSVGVAFAPPATVCDLFRIDGRLLMVAFRSVERVRNDVISRWYKKLD
ncbi:MAG: hypothetical protein ACI87E_002573, partial [Mariniblastus sp.]